MDDFKKLIGSFGAGLIVILMFLCYPAIVIGWWLKPLIGFYPASVVGMLLGGFLLGIILGTLKYGLTRFALIILLIFYPLTFPSFYRWCKQLHAEHDPTSQVWKDDVARRAVDPDVWINNPDVWNGDHRYHRIEGCPKKFDGVYIAVPRSKAKADTSKYPCDYCKGDYVKTKDPNEY